MADQKERNLLFAVFAVQLKGVTPHQAMEAAGAWTVDPSRSLGQRLEDLEALTAADVELIERLVDEAVRSSAGDTEAALKSIHGAAAVRESFATLGGLAGAQTLSRPLRGEPIEIDVLSAIDESPGRYSQISEHGRGGMGRVLLVRDECLGREIALKELLLPHDAGYAGPAPSPMRESTSNLMRFLQEARITGQLEHPSIVPVYELGRRADGTLYYTMRLVRGRTLGKLIQAARTMQERLAALPHLLDVCQAIAYAHSHGVIHRDLKPSNIMVGEFGETVVLDWGLAKIMGQEDVYAEKLEQSLHLLRLKEPQRSSETREGEAIGTPHYMPPEQAQGRIAGIDQRSDVYSAGVVLYEILTGKPPFEGATPNEIIDNVLSKDPVPVLARESNAPPELVSVCEKAMRKDPAERYQTMAELRDEILRFQTGAFVKAYRYNPGEVLKHWYRDHRAVLNTAAVALFALFALGVYSYGNIWRARNSEHKQRVIAESARNAETKARKGEEQKRYFSQLHLAQSYAENFEYARAEQTLLDTPGKLRGWDWGFLMNRTHPEVYTVETPNSCIFGVAFSPDGGKIATSNYPEAQKVYDAGTGKELLALEASDSKQTQVFFSPDGKRLAGVGQDGTVNLWDAATGKKLVEFNEYAFAYSGLFDRTGRYLYVGFQDRKVRGYDLEEGKKLIELDTPEGPAYRLALHPKENKLAVGFDDNQCGLWDLDTRLLVYRVAGQSPGFSPDGTLLATILENDVRVYDAASGQERARLAGHDKGVLCARFNHDGSKALSASLDGTVKEWSTGEGRLLQTYCPTGGGPLSAEYLEDEQFIAIGTDSNRLLVADAQTGGFVWTVHGRGTLLWMAERQPRSNWVAVSGNTHSFQVFNLFAPTGASGFIAPPLRITGGEEMRVANASASGDRLAALGPRRDSVYLYDFGHNGVLGKYQGTFGQHVFAAGLSADGARMVVLFDANAPTVWNVAGQSLLCAVLGHPGQVDAVALSPDGKHGLSGGEEKTGLLWNAETGQTELALEGHAGPVTCVGFSPDGKRLLTGDASGAVRLWSAQDGKPLSTLSGHRQRVTAAAFTSNGARLATIAADGNAILWDAATGNKLGAFHTEASVGALFGNFDPDFDLAFACGDQFLVCQSPYSNCRILNAATLEPSLVLERGEFLRFAQDNRHVVLTSPYGAVYRMEAAPFTKAMGNGSNEASAAFSIDAYHDYQRRWPEQKSASVASGSALCVVVAVAKEDLLAFLDALSAGVAEAPGPESGDGIPIPSNDCILDLAAVGFEAGDILTRIEDTAPANGAQAAALLKELAAKFAAQEKPSLRLQILRDHTPSTWLLRAAPLNRQSRAMKLTRAEGLDLLQSEFTRLSDCIYGNKHAGSYEYKWLRPVTVTPPERLAKAGAPGLFGTIIRYDDRALPDLDQVEAYLSELRARLLAGQAVRFAQTFQEGPFCRVTVNFDVAGE